jgi:hypothetical protein
MNSFLRFFRNTLEKLAKTFEEGPEPPLRLRDEVRMFRVMHPLATAEQWYAQCLELVDAAYRQGFARGYEWKERDLDSSHKESERLADIAKHAVDIAEGNTNLRASLDSGIDLSDPLHGIPAEYRAEFVDALGAYSGTHRVVLLDLDGNPIGRIE